jgi:hypothetical protein
LRGIRRCTGLGHDRRERARHVERSAAHPASRRSRRRRRGDIVVSMPSNGLLPEPYNPDTAPLSRRGPQGRRWRRRSKLGPNTRRITFRCRIPPRATRRGSNVIPRSSAS